MCKKNITRPHSPVQKAVAAVAVFFLCVAAVAVASQNAYAACSHSWFLYEEGCYAAQMCRTCGKLYNGIEVWEHEYAVTDSTQAANCTEQSAAIYTCTKCGDSYTEYGSYGNHEYMAAIGASPVTCRHCGTSGNTFTVTLPSDISPDEPVLRAMIPAVLYQLENRCHVESGSLNIAADSWDENAIRWAVEHGLVLGYGNGNYGLHDLMTREQIAVLLWRYSGCPAADNVTLSYSDTEQISDWALSAVQWAAKNDLFTGGKDGALDPKGIVHWAEAAQMLNEVMKGLV